MFYSVASIIWRVVMAAGSSSDGVISSVEYGLAYNWVVDVIFMVETPPVFFVSMASILDITKALVYQLLRCWFFSLYKLERGRRLNCRRLDGLDGRRLNCRRLDGWRLIVRIKLKCC